MLIEEVKNLLFLTIRDGHCCALVANDTSSSVDGFFVNCFFSDPSGYFIIQLTNIVPNVLFFLMNGIARK